jgi:hypothetical protein
MTWQHLRREMCYVCVLLLLARFVVLLIIARRQWKIFDISQSPSSRQGKWTGEGTRCLRMLLCKTVLVSARKNICMIKDDSNLWSSLIVMSLFAQLFYLVTSYIPCLHSFIPLPFFGSPSRKSRNLIQTFSFIQFS